MHRRLRRRLRRARPPPGLPVPPRRRGSGLRTHPRGAWQVGKRPLRDFHGPARPLGAALLRAARATAAFPVAFAPVQEAPMADHRDPPSAIPSSSVMDGGVLDNEPFRPVLDAIGERLADRRPERVLVYVVPFAGTLRQEAVGRKRPEDITWTEAAATALHHPREANFRSATEDLAERMRTRVSGVQEHLFRELYENPVRATRLLHRAAELLDDYRRSRAAAVVWDVRRQASADDVTALLDLPGTAADWLPGRNPGWLPQPPPSTTTPCTPPTPATGGGGSSPPNASCG
ncbi:patatin-like phospholipase family protein [Kitasatospora arboriphila]